MIESAVLYWAGRWVSMDFSDKDVSRRAAAVRQYSRVILKPIAHQHDAGAHFGNDLKVKPVLRPYGGGETMVHERRSHHFCATGRAPSPQGFEKSLARYRGHANPRGLSCWDQCLAMVFAQLTYRERLRDIEACLCAMSACLGSSGLATVY
jgi:hypothetical protein